VQEIAKTALNDARLAPMPKLEVEIWRKLYKLAVLDFLSDFTTIYGSICHRLAAKNYFRFGRHRK